MYSRCIVFLLAESAWDNPTTSGRSAAVAYLLWEQMVAGSIPAAPTNLRCSPQRAMPTDALLFMRSERMIDQNWRRKEGRVSSAMSALARELPSSATVNDRSEIREA